MSKHKKEEIYARLFNFSRPTYFKWKREGVPAMQLLLKYFTDEELDCFLATGVIPRMETRAAESEEFKLFREFVEWKKWKAEQ
ncbi:MAG: hypothetical protein U9Q62_08465 [Campylobacterota bacterium]|nr:hypothetical protein [Campylobacterota bacterium]